MEIRFYWIWYLGNSHMDFRISRLVEIYTQLEGNHQSWVYSEGSGHLLHEKELEVVH
jgi:hypothetical protein